MRLLCEFNVCRDARRFPRDAAEPERYQRVERISGYCREFPILNEENRRIPSKPDRFSWHSVCLITGVESVIMTAMMKILVPIDFEEASDIALVYGRSLAKAFGAELHVLHVMENQFLRLTFKSAAAVEAGIANRVAERLTPEDRSSLHAVAAVRMSDEPSDEIIQYAELEGIDLIVMGTHGGAHKAHLLMGSVAEKVVRMAPCPVLTVHHPEHEFVVSDVTQRSRISA